MWKSKQGSQILSSCFEYYDDEYIWIEYKLNSSWLAHLNFYKARLTPIRPGGMGEGGGAESARSDFNFRELPCYLSKSYQMLPLVLILSLNTNKSIFCLI